MQVNTKAIVLTAIKYGDTSLIVKAFTASDGLKAYMLKGVLASRKGKLKPAYFQPLTQLELTAYHRNKGSLESIREAKVSYPYRTLYSEMGKNTLALFLAEVLGHSIREEEPNPSLFEFLEASLQWLDNHAEIANFHCYFMLRLTKYLGFYPDESHSKESFFDLMEGQFTDIANTDHGLTGQNLVNFKSLLGINFDTIHTVRMNKTDRRELLQSIILYYELHLQGFRRPKSLAVLNEVFN